MFACASAGLSKHKTSVCIKCNPVNLAVSRSLCWTFCSGLYARARLKRSAGYLRVSVKLNFVAKCQRGMQQEVGVTDAPNVTTPPLPLIELVP